MMTPEQRYQRDLAAGDIFPDAAQAQVVRHTQRIYEDLSRDGQGRVSLLRELWRRFGGRRALRGLYLWGGVGGDKSWLMDTLFECLPFADKRRAHFHSFMQTIHRDLEGLRDRQLPLDVVAERMAKEMRVLCLDEFHVGDIADAMLLLEGAVRAWRDLGRDLQRGPPAALLERPAARALPISGGIDYRLRTLEKAEIYHCPLDDSAEHGLRYAFEHLARGPGRAGLDLEVAGRAIPAVRHIDGVVWFDFEGICGGPRGAADYVEIALCHHTVLIGNIRAWMMATTTGPSVSSCS